MNRNPIIRLPLLEVLRPEIAMALAQVYGICTIGGFLTAWRIPQNRPLIEQVFDSPEQAHNALATFAAWLGLALPPAPATVRAWWRDDAVSRPNPAATLLAPPAQANTPAT